MSQPEKVCMVAELESIKSGLRVRIAHLEGAESKIGNPQAKESIIRLLISLRAEYAQVEKEIAQFSPDPQVR